MILIFLVLLLTILGFSFFSVTTKITGINRVMMNMPKELFQTSIPLIQDDEFIAYYDKKALESNVTGYLNKHLKKFVSEYTIDFYYYNQLDESMCISEMCDAVEVSLSANIVFEYRYERTMFYEIKKGNSYGL